MRRLHTQRTQFYNTNWETRSTSKHTLSSSHCLFNRKWKACSTTAVRQEWTKSGLTKIRKVKSIRKKKKRVMKRWEKRNEARLAFDPCCYWCSELVYMENARARCSLTWPRSSYGVKKIWMTEMKNEVKTSFFNRVLYWESMARLSVNETHSWTTSDFQLYSFLFKVFSMWYRFFIHT